MARLKEIRNRISSIKSTRQVTSAMKMVSAAKLKKAQDMILKLAPYDNKLREIMLCISSSDNESENPYIIESEPKNVLIIVIGANRGLCSGFNSNVVKKAITHGVNLYPKQIKAGSVFYLPVGRQVEKGLAVKEVALAGEENHLLTDHDYDEVSRISKKLMKQFVIGQYQRIEIIYNKFKNAAVQEITIEQFLPLQRNTRNESSMTQTADFIFEPSKSEIFNSLIPQWLTMQLYRILLDSNAAEQGARMTSMHQATENATELIKELQISYNNARQTAITNEIVEITAGAEALKS